MNRFWLFVLLLLAGCEKRTKPTPLPIETAIRAVDVKETTTGGEFKKEVPVLCYHNFTESTNTIITLSHERFEEHIRSLVDSGYHSILPDELYDYLTAKAGLPSKPIMISFDDTRLAQYFIAAPILEKYGFKAVFFIMTVCVNKPNYLSSTMINDLATRGNVIGVHTYDHPLVSTIRDELWPIEVEQPKIFLENVIHNKVDYFAYPYGPWTEKCIEQLKKNGYKAAFQLDGNKSAKDPLYTIRRLMVQGNWSVKTLHAKIGKAFNHSAGKAI